MDPHITAKRIAATLSFHTFFAENQSFTIFGFFVILSCIFHNNKIEGVFSQVNIVRTKRSDRLKHLEGDLAPLLHVNNK